MKMNIIKTEYYELITDDSSSAAGEMLSIISKLNISLLAYKSLSIGMNKTKFTLFAIKSKDMSNEIIKEGYAVEGPFPGLFIDGDDVPGALEDIFKKLSVERIKVIESFGIANINNGYGVVLYLNSEDIENAYSALSE
jgi:hypothetical protein